MEGSVGSSVLNTFQVSDSCVLTKQHGIVIAIWNAINKEISLENGERANGEISHENGETYSSGTRIWRTADPQCLGGEQRN